MRVLNECFVNSTSKSRETHKKCRYYYVINLKLRD